MDTSLIQIVAVVDDDPTARSAAVNVLEAAGYLVTAYESGADFLSKVPQRAPAAILLDFHLGDMDGLKVLEILERRGIRRPTVILTSEPRAPGVREAEATGRVSAVLATPRDWQEVVDAIRSALGG